MKWILILLVLSSAFFSCKKDDPKPKSKTTLLTQKEWHPVTVIGRTSRTHIPDSPVILEQCSLDNVFRFGTNGSYVVDDGATACSYISVINSESGTWSFAQNETYLTLVITDPAGSFQKDCNIEILDENTLRYTFYNPSEVYYYQCTFSH